MLGIQELGRHWEFARLCTTSGSVIHLSAVSKPTGIPYNWPEMVVSQLSGDVKMLREGLGKLPEPVVRPSLVVVSGLPGTGKSYFCLRLAERVPFAILESDRLRKWYTGCL